MRRRWQTVHSGQSHLRQFADPFVGARNSQHTLRANSNYDSRIRDKSAYAATGAAIRSTVHNGRMTTRNPDWDALRDAIALIRARNDAEIDLMLPRVLEANDDGTVSVDPTFVRELAALVTISRDLSKMVDDELLDRYWARKLAATGSGAR
jgi:hypothetical protein